MPPPIIRAKPLNVLVALADADPDFARVLPALIPHYALICATPAQAVETARQFEPDVVFIDCRMPDPAGFIRDVLRVTGGRNMVFVSMHSRAEADLTDSQFSLPLPATAGDLESLLWRIAQCRPADPQHISHPGTGMIG